LCSKLGDKFKDRFNLSAWTFDEAVIGGQQGEWKVSKPETLDDENLAEAIVKIEEKIKLEDNPGKEISIIHHQFHLGNFSKFGNLLQELIGKEQFKIDDAK
jgi:hypothetical protein